MNSRNETMHLLGVITLLMGCFSQAQANRTGLVEEVDPAEGSNQALLVAVGHGLPGLDIDIQNIENIVTSTHYGYRVSTLIEEEGTATAIERDLEHRSRDTREGSLLFYYTGHGNVGSLYPAEADAMKISRIRQAIERGREGLPPLERLVMIYDACHSGSFLDPFRRAFPTGMIGDQAYSAFFVDDLMEEFTLTNTRDNPYFRKLFILASTMPHETCLASPEGSLFTNAFAEAYAEVSNRAGTLRDLFVSTRDKTVGSTPTARFVPASLGEESIH